MMKKLFLLFMTALMGFSAVQAIPAFPGKRVITLKDGSQVEVTFCGDEHFSFYADSQGKCYVSKLNGTFEEVASDEITEIWTSKVMNAQKRRASLRRSKLGVPGNPIVGNKKGIVILAEFPDKGFSMDNPQAFYQDFFNKIGYSDNGQSGSVRDYFKDQSYGKLDIEFTVVGPVMMGHNINYYGAPNGSSNDTRPQEMIKEAIEGADKDVNYADYDWDGDGEVDQVFVIYAGHGQNYENYGVSKNTIWPHESNLKYYQIYLKPDGVMVGTYGCSCELGTYDAGKRDFIEGIGSPCHEFSHCLGLPDMYDTSSGSNFGMGSWDVMCQGSYNNNSCTPAGYTSYERMFAGWLVPTELNSKTRVNGMKPLVDAPEAFIMYNEANRNEFYMLENRQTKSWDAHIGGHGLLVVHGFYDEEAFTSNSVNVGRQCMTIIPAGKVLNNYSSAPFPGSSNVTELTNYSTPAATLYEANVDGRKLMSKPIDNITEDKEAMTVSFVACRPELGIPSLGEATELPGSNGFTATWTSVNDALGYEIELTTMDRAASTPEESLLKVYDFSQCYSKSVGITDISSKLGNYGLSGWSGSKLYTTPNKLRLGTSSSVGSLESPTMSVPSSSDLTIVIGADKVNSDVKGTLRITYGNQGDLIADCPTQSAEFEVKGNEKLVFNFKDVRKNLFWIEIMPKAQMYLNYLAIYDGIWTKEQLGIANASPRRAAVVNTYTTETNSYTFTGLDTNKRFSYRVRALGEDNTASLWSEGKAFEFSTTGIQAAVIEPSCSTPVRYFDLQGREVGNSAHGLVIMKQGNVVKKVMK